MFCCPLIWGTREHLLAEVPKSHVGQHSLGLVTTGLPKQSSLVRKKQPILKQNCWLFSTSHWHVKHGVSDHCTVPSGSVFTQPLNLQLLSSQDGQHSPFGVTGLAHRGLAQSTALQSTGFPSPRAREGRRRERVVRVNTIKRLIVQVVVEAVTVFLVEPFLYQRFVCHHKC